MTRLEALMSGKLTDYEVETIILQYTADVLISIHDERNAEAAEYIRRLCTDSSIDHFLFDYALKGIINSSNLTDEYHGFINTTIIEDDRDGESAEGET